MTRVGRSKVQKSIVVLHFAKRYKKKLLDGMAVTTNSNVASCINSIYKLLLDIVKKSLKYKHKKMFCECGKNETHCSFDDT